VCCSIKPVASPTHEPCHLLSKRSIQDDVGTAVPMITHVCLTSYARYASSAPCSVTTGLNCKGSQKPTSEFLIIKPTRCTNFSNLFWKETLHVLDSSSVPHQEFSTIHTAMVYVVQFCWQHARRIRMDLKFHPCCVYSGKLLVIDRGTVRNM